jgi:hypothetical protein
MLAVAAEPWSTSPAEAQEFIASETARWRQVIRQAQIRPD